jgi:tRNA threonylcarbamoyladenosine biosynthesis protein TsaE
MKLVKEINFQLDEIDVVCSSILPFVEAVDIVLLEGEMGAGKTTFMSHLVKALGSKDHVTSPTYSLVNKYILEDSSKVKNSIYHLDLFRLKSLEEAIDIGIEDILYSAQFVFVEWPELLVPYYEEMKLLQLKFKKINTYSRNITIFMHE